MAIAPKYVGKLVVKYTVDRLVHLLVLIEFVILLTIIRSCI